MAARWLRTCFVAGFALYQVSNGRAITAPPPEPSLAPREASTATNTACAVAASAAASNLDEHPNGIPRLVLVCCSIANLWL